MERRRFESIDSVQSAFAAERYVADRDLATAVYLSLALDRPLLLEGEAGVGKTEVGRTLEIRLLEARGEAKQAAAKDIFSEEFLIRRPLLRALENSRPEPPVLLIDEVDRADEEFEAYLLEVLADFAITIPEVGTIRADRPPHVIITSNRTREVHDALKRRCLYHWIDYPSSERELAILGARRPDLPQTLAAEVVAFVQRLRAADLTKVPGIAETIDWAAALEVLGARRLEAEQVERTLGALLKYQEDMAVMKGGGAAKVIDEMRAAPR